MVMLPICLKARRLAHHPQQTARARTKTRARSALRLPPWEHRYSRVSYDNVAEAHGEVL